MHEVSKIIINAAIDVLAEIRPTTVRSVCYQLFTRGLIANMSKNETAKVSRLLTGARERGEIPWHWIVDETRGVEQAAQWRDGVSFIDSVMSQYRKDYWREQPYHVEVLSEKGTVRGVLASVLDEYGVAFRVMHGFGSATVLNDMAGAIASRDKPTVLLYVGDWDPSGLYMSQEDMFDRLIAYGAIDFTLQRIALTEADVKRGDLPYFEATTKTGDARYQWFVQRYGDRCWELDAMNPNDLRQRLDDSILEYLDVDAWNHMIEIERAERESMEGFMGQWKRTFGASS
ncbi:MULTISPECIES: hypothetical protein [unclassified Cupriavidus]|uniref:hypothetical protein n=1 Tax=unclassified Cupriavidus TaxID=2640874 RepID=UPI001CECD59B|nr:MULTISPECIES: hypothetical protein [unclassified Cupriavidus]